MDPEDFRGKYTGEMPLGYHDPLKFVDTAD